VLTLRPHQWAKNVLLFVPLVTSHQFTGTAAALAAAAAAAFCLAASSGYLVNDLRDISSDRHHPVKRHRPLAAGHLKPGPALVGAVVLAAAAFAVGAVVLNPAFLWAVILYYGVTLTYSAFLKRFFLVDVLTLTFLYTLRIYAGAVAIRVPVSFYLLAFSLAIFTSLALLKRYNELDSYVRRHALSEGSAASADAPPFGRPYRVRDLKTLKAAGPLFGYVSVAVLALYIGSPAVKRLYASHAYLWLLCPLFLFWITRIWFLVRRRAIPYDPVAFALRDPLSWCVAASAGLVIRLAMGG
jgi:4-hydroxybenzoate polyprenyltransferase